ncbi:MAG: PQQ-binding-like beta-propeller repeat protein [Armatimonadetes bacterium]|nr:PQQ-binding-like beta-propeller repeat protein [Armatimonadota bacterium]
MRRLQRGVVWLGLIACAGWIAVAAPGNGWPGWRGLARDGKSADRNLLREWPEGGPALAWKTPGIGAGFSSVAVAGEALYITGILDNELVLTAMDKNGKVRWQVKHGPEHGEVPGARATPVVDGDRVYLTSGTGRIGCFNARTGARLWSREMSEFGAKLPTWGYAESVLIYRNLAIVTPGGENCIVALNKRTGQTVWQSTGFAAPAHYGSCIAVEFGGVPMIVAGTGGGLFAVDARSGALLWHSDFAAGNTANCPTPAYADGYVFWANGYGKGGVCMKLTAANGTVTATEAWRTNQMDCHHGGYVIVDGFIYGNHRNGWTCLDLKTGEVKWSERGVGKGSLCYADGLLFFFSENNGRAALAPATPEGLMLKGEVSVAGNGPSWAHPVVTGGRLYLRYDNTLYCFNVAAR